MHISLADLPGEAWQRDNGKGIYCNNENAYLYDPWKIRQADCAAECRLVYPKKRGKIMVENSNDNDAVL